LPELIAAVICAEMLLGKTDCVICGHCGQVCKADAVGVKV
jgi:hypothetical protein